MKTKNKTAPATAKAADLKLTPEIVVGLGGGFSQKLELKNEAEVKQYEALRAKHPSVHKMLSDVALGVYQIADQSRKLVSEIVAADMKHEDSKLMLAAWGYGKDRISMIHRIVDAAPATRQAYLKGDFGLKRAVMEARAEGDGEGEGRGGARGKKKEGGTKAQREELAAIAEKVAKDVAEFLPSKLPIKTQWVRLGTYPWEVKIEIRHNPVVPVEAVEKESE